MNILIRDVPDDVHTEFRIMCFLRKVSMNRLLNQMIAETVATDLAKEEKKAKKK